jgi:hypothetical protein
MRNIVQYPVTLQEKLHEIEEARARAEAEMGDSVGDISLVVWDEIRRDVLRANVPEAQATSPAFVG